MRLASYAETSNYILQHKISGKQLGAFYTRNNNALGYNLSPSSSDIEGN
jgi:hypothetical protein